jgi:hypothetical protein
LNYTSNPLSFAAGKLVIYIEISYRKISFGTYSNVVTFLPIGSDNVIATANITADCEIAHHRRAIPEDQFQRSQLQRSLFQKAGFRNWISLI